MHLIIPFAASDSQGFAETVGSLQLPHLQKLLARLRPQPLDSGDATSLSPPHERALARALGLSGPDGQIPWAAFEASQQVTRPAAGGAWAFIHLCHWRVNTGQVSMAPWPLPEVSAAESAALLAAMRPYFEEDGITLLADQPGRWLAQAEVFGGLACAALDRVLGRGLTPWMPEGLQAAPLRRLQNEMQMLLYTHPVNEAREARGLAPLNSFWLSGAGALPASYSPQPADKLPQVEDSLRGCALAEDWPAWARAWQALDAGVIASLLKTQGSGEPLQITLCGERASRCWQNQPQPAWQKFKNLFASAPVASLLENL
jgi:hypothetical protein